MENLTPEVEVCLQDGVHGTRKWKGEVFRA